MSPTHSERSAPDASGSAAAGQLGISRPAETHRVVGGCVTPRPDASEDAAVVRVGIVGSGFMIKPHTLAFSNLPVFYGKRFRGVDLVRACDIDPNAAREATQRFGWRESTSDWRDITRADDIDLVDVVTPNDSHAEVVLDAAEHGKHVLCEKPLASTLDDARRMYRAARDAGVVHHVGFVYRKWPAMRLAKRLAARGALGKLLTLRAHYFHDYAGDPLLPKSWRFDRGRAGAGSVGDIGSHVIDLGRYLVGDIDRVFARSRTFMARRPRDGGAAVDVDDSTDMFVDFVNGVAGTMHAGWMVTGCKTDLSFELTGDRGAVRFTWQRMNELDVYLGEDDPEIAGFRSVVIGPQHDGAAEFWPVAGQGMGWDDAFLLSAHDVVQEVICPAERGPSFLDGLRAMEVVSAAQRSSESGSWVSVERHPV